MDPTALVYSVAGQRVVLPIASQVVGVRFTEPAPYVIRRQEARAAQLMPFEQRYEVPGEKYTIFQVLQPLSGDQTAVGEVTAQLQRSSQVDRATPLYRYGDLHVLVTDRLLLTLRPGGEGHLDELRRARCEILKVEGRLVTVRLPQDRDPLEAVEWASSLEWIEAVEPDLVSIGAFPQRRPVTPGISPSAPLGVQPALVQIHADRAWQEVQGQPQIRIAVLDDGVDRSHPALRPAIVHTYDAVTDSDLVDPNPWDSHGTACAGLAAGQDDTGFLRGVAAGCSLMPIRVALSPGPNLPWTTSVSYLRRAIDWATDHGADVLSNSWGGGAPSPLVVEAFERARQSGRKGRGCVVVVAAGNDGQAVQFPGTLDGVITVAGVNALDEVKTRTSQDGEYWWASSTGPSVALAAPSVGLRTTDLRGPDGLAAGDWSEHFNGTSAATPLVAGAAALLLCAQPDLTSTDVLQALCDTADKVGADPYIHGRNDVLGYGRLNVAAALEQIQHGSATAPKPSESGTLTGRLQLAAGLPVFYLDTGEQRFLLKKPTSQATGDALTLEHQTLNAFQQWVGRQITVRFSSREHTAQGDLLWGATAEVPRGSNLPVPPGEVRLISPDEDVFARPET